MFYPSFNELGLPEVCTIIAGLAFVMVLVNYLLNYLPVTLLKKNHLDAATEPPPVSVIICARNEEDNLAAFLPKILAQKYPKFEVVVVNDCSDDNTGNVVDALAVTHPHLRKADIKEDAYYKHGKKFAMLVGIKSASYGHLVFTDADCYPASDQWLRNMAEGFTPQREIVLGYGSYEKQEGMLNDLIRYDTFSNAVMYLSAAIRKKPYMGVGRNLAYNKELFFRNKGFATHYHLKSGDDDLFVNEVANNSNTNVCIAPEAITISKPEVKFREWNLQKARHLTTAPLYKSGSRGRLMFNHFSQYFFLLALIALAFSMETVLFIPALLLLNFVVHLLVMKGAVKKLGEPDLLVSGYFYGLILLFIYPIFQATKIFNKKRWTI